MKKVFVISTLAAAAGLASMPVSAEDILARVISSTPVVQQVAVPRQVCTNEAVVTQSPKSGAGALMGALAGGAAGNAIGNGGGRAAATMLGLVGGAVLGDRIEGPNNQLQNMQRCSTQTYYENRPSHYNVVYEYQGTQYNVQMANDPGSYVRLQVTPVGALQNSPQPYPPQPSQSAQPQTYMQPPPVQQQQQQVYEQPEGYPTYYVAPAQPVYVQPYYARPSYYAPFYPPIGLSLNFGYSRGFGGGHRHWR
jgi:uncharacterized protein YcfJ